MKPASEDDVRWHQRLNSYQKAFNNLQFAVETAKMRKLTQLESQGLIKAFELVYEQAWLSIKAYFEYEGEVGINGSRDAFRLAFNRGLISDGSIFMQSIKTRQLSIHTYSEDVAEAISKDIVELYYDVFKSLLGQLTRLKQDQ